MSSNAQVTCNQAAQAAVQCAADRIRAEAVNGLKANDAKQIADLTAEIAALKAVVLAKELIIANQRSHATEVATTSAARMHELATAVDTEMASLRNQLAAAQAQINAQAVPAQVVQAQVNAQAVPAQVPAQAVPAQAVPDQATLVFTQDQVISQ